MDAHTSGTLYYVCTDRVILKTEYRDDGGDRVLWSPSATPTRAGIKRSVHMSVSMVPTMYKSPRSCRFNRNLKGFRLSTFLAAPIDMIAGGEGQIWESARLI